MAGAFWELDGEGKQGAPWFNVENNIVGVSQYVKPGNAKKQQQLQRLKILQVQIQSVH